jgi:hypothetical protein
MQSRGSAKGSGRKSHKQASGPMRKVAPSKETGWVGGSSGKKQKQKRKGR